MEAACSLQMSPPHEMEESQPIWLTKTWKLIGKTVGMGHEVDGDTAFRMPLVLYSQQKWPQDISKLML